MNNFDRLECIKFMADGKIGLDTKALKELLQEMDNVTPELLEMIEYALNYIDHHVELGMFNNLAILPVYMELKTILEV